MNIDPHHIPDNRLKIFLEAGVGRVAGVPFDLPDCHGIVLFFAKSDTSYRLLDDESNVEFLKKSSFFIGTALSLCKATTASLTAKQNNQFFMNDKDDQDEDDSDLDDYFISKGDDFSTSSDTSSDDGKEARSSLFDRTHRLKFNVNRSKSSTALLPIFTTYEFVREKFTLVKDKFLDINPTDHPPAMSSSECIWTFVGVFLTLIVVCGISEAVTIFSHSNMYTIPVGPFGAFSTLLFGLTAAPPSQPRNAIYGSVIAGCTGLLLSTFSGNLHILRIPLATSITVSIMGRAGVIHPPAGALAIIMSSGKYHWGTLLSYILTIIPVIAISVVVNNMNEKRKYPQYWNMIPKKFQ